VAAPVPRALQKKSAKSLEYKGYLIEAQPYREGGQFQTAGTVSKEIVGTKREHRFVRADRFSTAEEAADHSINKGCQIVDERGDRVFD
jgi:hypothetical protein